MTPYGLHLNKFHYIRKAFRKLHSFDIEPAWTPYCLTFYLKKNESVFVC